MIRGYVQYKTIWESPSHCDELFCECEIGHTNDTHTIKKDIGGITNNCGAYCHKYYENIFTLFKLLQRGGTVK